MKTNSLPALFISSYDDIKNPHYGGGGAIAVHEIAKRLRKKYTVTVLSWDYNGRKKETIEGVNYERFGSKALSPKLAMFAYQTILPFEMKKRQFDVWLESFCPPFTTAMLPKFTTKPVIGIVHMLASEDMERKYKLPFHLVENVGLKLYKNIIVTSDAIKNKVKAVNPQAKITCISNGIDTVYTAELKRKKYILFLGRIEVNQKGLDLLIGAFNLLAAKFPDYELHIAGSGTTEEISKLKTLVQASPVSARIRLIGKVNGDKKTLLLREAACLVVPSRFETYSLVALESLAHGSPLVTFPIKGLSWLTNTMATKAKSLSAASLSEAISTVLQNPSAAQEKVKAGKAYAKQYTWDSVAVLYTDYIASFC